MTNSTFWHDGYKDGFNGFTYSPPDPHPATNVFTQEYSHGYQCGSDAKDSVNRTNNTIFGYTFAQIQHKQGR